MATTDALQIQARALGDPTRHRIFRFVADADAAVGVAELTEHLGLNHNAVRQHLTKLVDAELLVEDTAAPSGRGRPKLIYTVNPNTHSRWGVAGPYERLAVLLAEVLRTGDDPEEVGRRAGLRVRLGAQRNGHDAVKELTDEMARQGFEPELRRSGDDFTLVLASCPFAAAAMADQNTVCRLHLGLARGAAEAIGGLDVQSLAPRDPRTAHCHLSCRVDPAVEAVDPAAEPALTAASSATPASDLGPASAGRADRPSSPPSTADLPPSPDQATRTELR